MRRLAIFGLALLGCTSPPPPPPPVAITASVQGVVSQLRTVDADAATRLELALREAHLGSAQRRDSAGLLWHDAMQQALGHRLALRRRHAELEREWQDIASKAREAVTAAGNHVDRLARRRDAKALGLARADLAAAEGLAAAGRLQEAIALAHQSFAESRGLEQRHEALMARFSDPEELAQWRRWASETVSESRRRRTTAIVVNKLAGVLMVYRNGSLARTLPIELGSRGYERKLYSGDHATPEGRYKVVQVKKRPNTIYYKAWLLDYPNSEDRRRWEQARQAGQISKRVGIGNLIEIHGDGGQGRNWTQGCVALTNDDIDSIWPLVSLGTPVTIVGAL